MIIARLCGGLGNQMFQYAIARRLAERHRTELLLDTRVFAPNSIQRCPELAAFNRELRILQFDVKARKANDHEIELLRDSYLTSSTKDRLVRVVRRFNGDFLWKRSHLIERQYRFDRDALNYPDNIYLEGYWQSEKYFVDIAPLIKKELTISDADTAESAKLAVAKLRARFGTVIALHVRRGDHAFAHEKLKRTNITAGAPVSREYIQEAISCFSPDACFFVFSDSPEDIQWCRENVHAANLEFSNATSDIWDFAAMSLCDHNITGNSTFSWWAAWLNPNSERRVITPARWSPPEAATNMSTEDLIPSSWTKI